MCNCTKKEWKDFRKMLYKAASNNPTMLTCGDGNGGEVKKVVEEEFERARYDYLRGIIDG